MTEIYPPATRRLFPIFRMVFGFAAACFVGALVTDIVYVEVPDMQWSNFSMWLITVGLIVAAVAANVGLVIAAVATLIGLIDRLVHGRFGMLSTQWPYLLGFAAVVVVSIFNAFVHSRDAYQSVVPTGLTLSIVAVVTLLLIPVFERGARPAARLV